MAAVFNADEIFEMEIRIENNGAAFYRNAARWNVAFFRRKNHLGDPSIPINTAVRDLVQKNLGGGDRMGRSVC